MTASRISWIALAGVVAFVIALGFVLSSGDSNDSSGAVDAGGSKEPTTTIAAAADMPAYKGGRSDLAEWLTSDGNVIEQYVTETHALVAGDTSASVPCNEIQQRLERNAPKPPDVQRTAGSSPDEVLRDLTANDLRVKVELLQACLRGEPTAELMSEARQTHSLLTTRLQYLGRQTG